MLGTATYVTVFFKGRDTAIRSDLLYCEKCVPPESGTGTRYVPLKFSQIPTFSRGAIRDRFIGFLRECLGAPTRLTKQACMAFFEATD